MSADPMAQVWDATPLASSMNFGSEPGPIASCVACKGSGPYVGRNGDDHPCEPGSTHPGHSQVSWKEPDESLHSQVDRLGTFIIENVPGEPSQSEGAIDCAIRILAKHYLEGALADPLEESEMLVSQPSSASTEDQKWLRKLADGYQPGIPEHDLLKARLHRIADDLIRIQGPRQ
jgi:hypothetical protein